MSTSDLVFLEKSHEVTSNATARYANDANMSRLSMEISLKVFLEKAGFPMKKIRKH